MHLPSVDADCGICHCCMPRGRSKRWSDQDILMDHLKEIRVKIAHPAKRNIKTVFSNIPEYTLGVKVVWRFSLDVFVLPFEQLSRWRASFLMRARKVKQDIDKEITIRLYVLGHISRATKLGFFSSGMRDISFVSLRVSLSPMSEWGLTKKILLYMDGCGRKWSCLEVGERISCQGIF